MPIKIPPIDDASSNVNVEGVVVRDRSKERPSAWLSFWVGFLAFIWGITPIALFVAIVISGMTVTFWSTMGLLGILIICWFVSHNYITRIKS
jgi:hypothetical protein